MIVEATRHHHHKGNAYHFRIRLDVPGEETIVSRDPPGYAQHEGFYLAIDDALKETTRKLKDHHRRQGGKARAPRRGAPPFTLVLAQHLFNVIAAAAIESI
jgi:hypothetical protein